MPLMLQFLINAVLSLYVSCHSTNFMLILLVGVCVSHWKLADTDYID